MYCGQCGTPNPEDAGNCETCGAPLIASDGIRTCGNCGASIGDHDRFCTACGAQAAVSSVEHSYDATDDFGELDIDEIEIDELPDWLQGMAPQTSTQPPQMTPSDQPTPDDLPDWLRDTPDEQPVAPPPPPPAEQRGVDHQPADQFSLVSDEDLPDWLKALSDEDEDTTQSTIAQPVRAQTAGTERSTAVANLFEVPPVSRAWLSQGRTVDESQISAARQEFLPLEVVAGARSQRANAQSMWDADPEDQSPNEGETRPFATAAEEAGTFAGRGRLIARIVILVLLVIVALILAVVLIQGI